MNKKLINLLLAFLILTGFTQQSLAEGWYVGGGIVKASFEDDLQSIDSGNGLAFNGGFGFNDNFSVDLLSGISIHDGGIFTGDIAQGFIMAGGKFSFGTDTFRPYLLAGSYCRFRIFYRGYYWKWRLLGCRCRYLCVETGCAKFQFKK